jgi:transposase
VSERPKPKSGRLWMSDWATLEGIAYVVRTGTPWEHLPRELGCCSGMTCWRRRRDWQQAVGARSTTPCSTGCGA